MNFVIRNSSIQPLQSPHPPTHPTPPKEIRHYYIHPWYLLKDLGFGLATVGAQIVCCNISANCSLESLVSGGARSCRWGASSVLRPSRCPGQSMEHNQMSSQIHGEW